MGAVSGKHANCDGNTCELMLSQGSYIRASCETLTSGQTIDTIIVRKSCNEVAREMEKLVEAGLKRTCYGDKVKI